MTLEVIRAMNI